MKYAIKNQGVLATIGHIKDLTGVDIMPSLQEAIAHQFDDASDCAVSFNKESVEKLTGIRSVIIYKDQVEALEPIDLTGWIPVDRADELPIDIDNYQACIVAEDEESIKSSDLRHLNLGYIYNNNIHIIDDVKGEDVIIDEGIFKLITL